MILEMRLNFPCLHTEQKSSVANINQQLFIIIPVCLFCPSHPMNRAHQLGCHEAESVSSFHAISPLRGTRKNEMEGETLHPGRPTSHPLSETTWKLTWRQSVGKIRIHLIHLFGGRRLEYSIPQRDYDNYDRSCSQCDFP